MFDVAQADQRVAPLHQRLQGAMGVGQEGDAGVGEADGAPHALEERLAQFALQRLDPGGDGGLGQIERVRRLGEGQQGGHLHERFQPTDLHGDPSAPLGSAVVCIPRDRIPIVNRGRLPR